MTISKVTVNPTHTQNLPQLQSTGLPRELLPPLKIKDNVDHAGPFPLPVFWKVPQKSKQEIFKVSLNNNWLIVVDQQDLDAKDATEPGPKMP